MIIKEVKLISFGKFKDKIISFEEGINVLFGENESGKSTIMSFIQFMFYGCTTKKTNIAENLKLKYMPWDSDIIEGELTYSVNDTDYVIHRKAGKRSFVDVINKTTGESLENDISKNIGTHLFGLSEDAFIKTYFIAQSGSLTGPDKDGTLVKRLSNIESDHDEDGSYTNVKKFLQEEILNLSSQRRSGALIPNLKAENQMLNEKLCEIENNIKQMDSSKEEYSKTSNKLKNLNIEKDSLKSQIELCEKAEFLRNYKELKEKHNNVNGKYCKAVFEHKKIDLSPYTAFENIDDETVNKISSDTGNDVNVLTSSVVYAKEKAKSSKIMGFASAIGALICAITGVFYPIALSGLAIFVLIAIYGFINAYLKGKKALTIEKEISKITEDKLHLLSLYNCTSTAEFIKKHSEYLSLLNKKASLETSIEFLKKELEDAKISFDKISQEILSKYDKLENVLNIFSECDNIGNVDDKRKRLDEISSLVVALTAREAILKDRLSAEENISEEYISTKESIEHNMALIDDYEKRLNVLNRALCILEKSFEEIKNNFAPKLNKNAGRILSEITGEKYRGLLINHDFDTRVDSGRGYYESPYFSGGTIDQLYFAVRFGIIETIADSQNSFPVFLDDVFCQSDSNRLVCAVTFLKNYSENNQIIYTTCHEREKTTFESTGNCNIVKL